MALTFNGNASNYAQKSITFSTSKGTLMARQRRLYIANGMREAVEAGADVGGTYSLARWREIQETFDAFETWLSTPLVGCGVPPLVVVSRRGNPPEPAAPPDPEPTPEPTPEEPAP